MTLLLILCPFRNLYNMTPFPKYYDKCSASELLLISNQILLVIWCIYNISFYYNLNCLSIMNIKTRYLNPIRTFYWNYTQDTTYVFILESYGPNLIEVLKPQKILWLQDSANLQHLINNDPSLTSQSDIVQVPCLLDVFRPQSLIHLCLWEYLTMFYWSVSLPISTPVG